MGGIKKREVLKLSLPEFQGHNWLGVWISNRTYQIGDVVHYEGEFYICTARNTGVNPTDKSAWDVYGDTQYVEPSLSPATDSSLGGVSIPENSSLTVDQKGNLDVGSDLKNLLKSPQAKTLSSSVVGIDPATTFSFHFDIAADVTLSTVENAVEGRLYTMALDGTKSSHTVGLGQGFQAAGNKITVPAKSSVVLLFVGHNNNLQLVTTPVTGELSRQPVGVSA